MTPGRLPRSPPRNHPSKDGVQKRPSSIVPPRSQDSGRSQAVSGLNRSNTVPTRYNASDTLRIYRDDGPSRQSSRRQGEVISSHTDEQTAIQIDLSILETALNEIINENHSELQNRVSSGERSPKLIQLSQHLLASPPSSPDSIPASPSSQDSPTFLAKRAKLQMQTIEDLMKRDSELHHLMNDLNNIRRWWKGNKLVWHEMRDKVWVIEHKILLLQTRIDSHRETAMSKQTGISSKYDADMREFNALEDQKQAMLPWFVKNRNLMRLVWVRIKAMEATVCPQEKVNTKMALNYPPTDNITNLSWHGRKTRASNGG